MHQIKKKYGIFGLKKQKSFLCTSLHIQICDIQQGRSVLSFSIPSLPKKEKRQQFKHFICRQKIVYKYRILEWNGVGWLQIKNQITTDPCLRIYKYVNTINTFWIVNAPLGYSKARLASDIFYWEKKYLPTPKKSHNNSIQRKTSRRTVQKQRILVVYGNAIKSL